MRFEVSERVRTERSEQEIFAELNLQFKKVSRTLEPGHLSLKAVGIESTFGSINRHDETVVQMKRLDDGWLLVADVLYRPSVPFWFFLVIGLFSWVMWLVPLGFYLYQKKTVRASIESCFARIKNEFEQPGGGSPTNLDSALDSIAKLGALRGKGLISAEEYERKKNALLGEGAHRAASAPQDPFPAPRPRPTESFASPQPNLTDFRQADPHAIPDGVKGWSWGALFLNVIWAIGNKTWIGLLAFVPVLGLPVPFILGFKGREWAWKNKKWDSVEHFNRVQRQWSVWGVVFAVVAFMVYAIGLGIYAYQEEHPGAKFPWDSVETVASAPKAEELEPEEDPQLANAQSAPVHDQGKIDALAALPTQLTTVAGFLELRRPEGGDKALYLNQRQLFTGEDSKWHKIIKRFSLSTGEDVVLMASSGGRGSSCETLFFFLVMSVNEITYSPEFGSCANTMTYFRLNDSIQMRVPVMGGETVFNFDNKTLTENGQMVPMRDDIDPSK